MIFITKAQLKTILSLNIMSLCTIENEKDLECMEEVFNDYMECGANILIAPTNFADSNDEKEDIIRRTKKAAEDKVFVAGEIRISDYDGNLNAFKENIKEEVKFLDESEVSMIFINGAKSLTAAKYAYLSAKEVYEKPIALGLSFDYDGNLSDGATALSALITLQAMGVDAVGCVFDTDIDVVTEIFTTMCDFTTVPLFAYLNADFLTPEIFADYIPNLVNYKCAMFGISKGALLSHYIEMSKVLWQFKPYMPDFEEIHAVCSKKDIVFLDFKGNVIGDNKNILEIKIEDENTDLDKLLEIVNSENSGAICFSVKDPDILDKLLFEYVGRPLIKSDEYGEIAAKEKGAFVYNFESPTETERINDYVRSSDSNIN